MFHSNSFSGGAANNVNTLEESAPYSFTISSGSTPLFFDLLIFSTFVTNSSPVSIENAFPSLNSASLGNKYLLSFCE